MNLQPKPCADASRSIKFLLVHNNIVVATVLEQMTTIMNFIIFCKTDLFWQKYVLFCSALYTTFMFMLQTAG